MITDIQNFENAARIATADALLSEIETVPHASTLMRWIEAAWHSLFVLLKGPSGPHSA